ncbi:cupin domain-containing protein [Streptomyces sp. NEAU-H3]|uniref:cupin domain-containing protein n=1 Tax=Streptomyces sp. NEAU-H3 TaxID=2720636 RepID=UPI001439B9D9|nr:cupin domain-containing protein [Streptomyces sp. NEAU-H3]NJA57122.1 cupin domain-containing protein [Streptomyces sp. NEAU-H3]
MNVAQAMPDKNDPVWRAANGFVVRADQGVAKSLGHERFTVKVTGDRTDGAFALMDGTVKPSHGNSPHVHTQEDEAFYVLSGEFEFINGGQKFRAGPGDFVFIPRGTRHGFRNPGNEPARLLVFYTPAGPESFFLENGQEDGATIPLTREFYEGIVDRMAAHNIVILPGDDDWDQAS